MTEKIKLYAYAAMALLVIWFGYGFYSNYKAVTRASAEAATNDTTRVTAVEPATNSLPTTSTTPAATNDLAQGTNQTNDASNQVAAATNAAPPTNPPAVAPVANATTAPAPAHKGSQGAMIGYLAAFVVAIIGLGLLVANDVTQYMGSQTVDFLFDDDGEGARDPEYENAEKVWANGKPLEAIQMMREYLKDHPREQYVALRIAEIYEKDLRNYLAAALEYEEVLKKKIEPERWGWAAIHLCNLYSKLGKQDQTVKLLEKIIEKHPETAAAKKAREKLGLPELQEAATGAPAETPAAAEPEPAKPKRIRIDPKTGQPETPVEPAKPKEPEKPKLPPGFRPK